MEPFLEPIYHHVIEGNNAPVENEVKKLLADGIHPEIILNNALLPAMEEVGRLYEIGEYFVPEMLLSARSMQNAMTMLKPKLIEKDIKPMGKILIGTVQGDIHDIGKNLVATMLEGVGFEINNIGVDKSPASFIQALEENPADILAMSALITPTLVSMKATIDAIDEAGLRKQVKILVGGAPVTEVFAKEIGADGYAPDAGKAVQVAKTLLKSG